MPLRTQATDDSRDRLILTVRVRLRSVVAVDDFDAHAEIIDIGTSPQPRRAPMPRPLSERHHLYYSAVTGDDEMRGDFGAAVEKDPHGVVRRFRHGRVKYNTIHRRKKRATVMVRGVNRDITILHT